MDNMEQLQAVVNEVQAARQQVANLRAQVVELETTVDSVRNQPEELALHQQMGGVLVEVSDRKALLKGSHWCFARASQPPKQTL